MAEADRSARALRGAAAAVLSTFTAAFFHVAGGGAAPSPAAVALTLAFATLCCVALTGRRLSVWRLAASALLSQAIFHGLFTLGAGSGSSAMGAHMQAMPQLSAGVPLPAPPMWEAHLLAAAFTTLALIRGERAFMAILAWAPLLVVHLVRARALLAPLPPALLRLRPAFVRRIVPAALLLVLRLRHRGPPRGLVPAS